MCGEEIITIFPTKLVQPFPAAFAVLHQGNKFQTRWMALKRKQSDACNMLFIAAKDGTSLEMMARIGGLYWKCGLNSG